jgi:hypothetical protein
VVSSNAECGIGLICACLPALSSYFVSLKSNSRDVTTDSYQWSHELSRRNKLSIAKKNSNHDSLLQTQLDQAHLISTIEGPEQQRGSMASLQESYRPPSERPVIHKEVVVSQTYEVVK